MKSLTLSVLVVLCATTSINGLKLDINDIIKSTGDAVVGVAEDVIHKLPTPIALFEASKNLLIGYPFEFVSESINLVCQSALSSDTVKPKYTPDISKMHFQLRTACHKYNFPLLDANEMWNSTEFDANKKVVVLATGWTNTVNDSTTLDVLAKAYNCRGDVNFIVVDAANYVDSLYSWSAFNTEYLGMYIAEGLTKLIESVPLENIHLIGHSLGAHIVGAAGRHFQMMTKKNLPRITGLDPARPCFNEGERLTGLMRGDADFVDVIHSNPGVLGKREPMGDIDFYPGGLAPLPIGCYDISCAHARSCEYYAETLYPGNELNFIGTRCSSLTNLRELKCRSKFVPMGYAVPTNVKGNFFMEVNGNSPFGMYGSKQRSLNLEKCGLCEAA